MIPVVIILLYLVIVAFVGSVAFRRGKNNTEDFFLANRSVGEMVFFLSLFATNMTAFAILGSSGQAYRQGIGVYGLMASSSGLVIPLTIFFIGTRLWALGKRFGHQTQVAFFRDRWECDTIGTVIFALSAMMLVPYMIISLMGGGTVLAHISDVRGTTAPLIPYWLGCAIVALVVTLGVFLGGMRGTVWVNVLQTTLFLCFGTVAVLTISYALPGGFGEYMANLGNDPQTRFLVTRERMPPEAFWSYTLIPLSSIMFPHMAIMCFSARKVTAFKRTVILYPVAIMMIWLPCVFLGVLGVAALGKVSDADGILLLMLEAYAPAWLAGILGAGIISAVMGSDAHQVLALSTMFTKDIYQHYGGREKYGERGAVYFARAFIVVVTAIAYLIALGLKEKQGIFEIAVRYAFSGFAALAPVMLAALFWKRSTKWGALAATLFTAGCLILFAVLQNLGRPGDVFWQLGHGQDAIKVLFLNPRGDVSFWNGFMPVAPMVFGSALCVVIGSLLTRPPTRQTIDKYFPPKCLEEAEDTDERTSIVGRVTRNRAGSFAPGADGPEQWEGSSGSGLPDAGGKGVWSEARG